MHRIEDHFIPYIGLQAAPICLFFQAHRPYSLPAKYISTDQAAHAASDDQYIVFYIQLYFNLFNCFFNF